ncbi:MAG: potassium-transporting ATPase subunit KdpC [Nocardioides sp.]
MAMTAAAPVRQAGAALRTLIVLTVVVGLAYPLAMTGIAQVVLPGRADGSFVHRNGAVVGSALIGQAFTGAKGRPLPQYFQSRPSAAGSGYDPLASSASNLSPTNPELVESVRQRQAAAARLDGVPPRLVPPDALLASGSGLDPHISPAYAAQQVDRIARVRGVSVARVRALVAGHTDGRTFGFLGEPRVNVLELNLALDRLTG